MSWLLWKCPFRLQRYSFITTLFLGPFDDVITKFYCILSLFAIMFDCHLLIMISISVGFIPYSSYILCSILGVSRSKYIIFRYTDIGFI
jgi:hypothetical protein